MHAALGSGRGAVHVLLTRPRSQALKTKARLEALGHEASLAPLLEIELMAGALPAAASYSAILVTSANAVEALLRCPEADVLRQVPLYAVGDSTAEAAERAGWCAVHSAGGDAAALAGLAGRRLRPGADRALYAAGRERTGDLEGRLRAAGIAVDLAEVYRTRPVGTLPQSVAEGLREGRFDAILVYSARTARLLLDCLAESDLVSEARRVRIGALSEAIAAPFRAAGFGRVVSPGEPNERALLKELGLVP